jgi:hypothetical protein
MLPVFCAEQGEGKADGRLMHHQTTIAQTYPQNLWISLVATMAHSGPVAVFILRA